MLWAAARLFAERGVAGASTRDIAAAAGTTERTLFKHFGSKEGLLREVMDGAVLGHLAPASLDDLRAAIEACDGDLAAWHAGLLHARLGAMRSAPELTRLLLVEVLRDETARARFLEPWREAAWQPLLTLFMRLQREGHVRRDVEPRLLAAQFLATNVGFLMTRLLAEPIGNSRSPAASDAADIAGLVALFQRGVAPA
jgi:AcrR family transcriptional regulator